MGDGEEEEGGGEEEAEREKVRGGVEGDKGFYL